MTDIVNLIWITVFIIVFLLFVRFFINQAAEEKLKNTNDRISELAISFEEKITKIDNHIIVLSKNISTLIEQEIEKLRNEK